MFFSPTSFCTTGTFATDLDVQMYLLLITRPSANVMVRSGRKNVTGSGVRQREDHSRLQVYSNQDLFHSRIFSAHPKYSLACIGNSVA